MGAHAVLTRWIPPVQVADQLLACLSGEMRTIALRWSRGALGQPPGYRAPGRG